MDRTDKRQILRVVVGLMGEYFLRLVKCDAENEVAEWDLPSWRGADDVRLLGISPAL